MHEVITRKSSEIVDLCRRLEVRRLDLFGSASGDTLDADLLVEFATRPGFDRFGAYFALKEGLEAVLGRPVDLVSGSSIRNPYLWRLVLETRRNLYAAYPQRLVGSAVERQSEIIGEAPTL